MILEVSLKECCHWQCQGVYKNIYLASQRIDVVSYGFEANRNRVVGSWSHRKSQQRFSPGTSWCWPAFSTSSTCSTWGAGELRWFFEKKVDNFSDPASRWMVEDTCTVYSVPSRFFQGFQSCRALKCNCRDSANFMKTVGSRGQVLAFPEPQTGPGMLDNLGNRFVFPAPQPSYGAQSYKRNLCWIPWNSVISPKRVGDETASGIPCLWFPAPKAATVILFFHANAEDLGMSFAVLRHVRDQFKVNVLAVEYPGYGLLHHMEPSEAAVYEVALTAFRFLVDEIGVRTLVMKWVKSVKR